MAKTSGANDQVILDFIQSNIDLEAEGIFKKINCNYSYNCELMFYAPFSHEPKQSHVKKDTYPETDVDVPVLSACVQSVSEEDTELELSGKDELPEGG